MRGTVAVLASATGFGIMPIFAVLSYRHGLDPASLLFLRFAIAAAVLALLVTMQRGSLRVSRRQLVVFAVLGGLYAGVAGCYFTALQYIPAGLVALLLYLYPAFVAVLSAVLARRRLGWGVAGSLVLTFVGIWLALGAGLSGASLLGVGLGALAPFIYSVYIVTGERHAGGVPAAVMSSYVCLSGALCCLVAATLGGGVRWEAAARGWWEVLGVALFGGALALSAFFVGLAELGATRASILSTVEPVISVIGAALVLGGGLGAGQVIGAALVVIGAVLGVLAHARQEAAAADDDLALRA